MLVPNLRHVMTTASAIATIEGLYPGRLACGFGTGATARWVLNQKAVSWAATRRYLEQLRALLRGDVVEIDGQPCQMIHHPGWARARPIDTPLLLSAFGPKGMGITGELAAAGVIEGFIGMADAAVDVPWRVHMTAGTVLEPGESLTDERVRDALGPWYVVRYHGVWQLFPDATVGMPSGAEWLAGVNAERPEGQRHLAVHEGHVTNVMPRDRVAIEAAEDALATVGFVGNRDEVRAQADAALAVGQHRDHVHARRRHPPGDAHLRRGAARLTTASAQPESPNRPRRATRLDGRGVVTSDLSQHLLGVLAEHRWRLRVVVARAVEHEWAREHGDVTPPRDRDGGHRAAVLQLRVVHRLVDRLHHRCRYPRGAAAARASPHGYGWQRHDA